MPNGGAAGAARRSRGCRCMRREVTEFPGGVSARMALHRPPVVDKTAEPPVSGADWEVSVPGTTEADE